MDGGFNNGDPVVHPIQATPDPAPPASRPAFTVFNTPHDGLEPGDDTGSYTPINIRDNTPLLGPHADALEPGRPIQDVGHDEWRTAVVTGTLASRWRSYLTVGDRCPLLWSLRLIGVLFSSVLFVILVIGVIVSLLEWVTITREADVMTGSVVNIFCGHQFWFDKLTVKEQATSNKVEAHVYFENGDASSKENQTAVFFQSRSVSYPTPYFVYGFPEYLLAGSWLEINVTANGSASPASICQFTHSDDLDKLINAQTQDELRSAEKKGYCQPINPPTSDSTTFTSLSFHIRKHGYYYYAIAALSGELYLNYTYRLEKRFYDRNELTPYDCSVVSGDCVISGLTVVHRNGDFCILVYIPEDQSNPTYYFTSELSNPAGIILLIAIGVGIVIVLLYVMHHFYLAQKCEKKFY